MHPVNRFLSLFGLRLSRTNKITKQIDDTEGEGEFKEKYDYYYKQVQNNKRGFRTYKAYRYNAGEHPLAQKDLECQFVAYHLYKAKPKKILDIGSFRHFILGLLAHYEVTSVDIRERKSTLNNEKIITCDAKALNFANNSFDSVISLQALPHFGLMRYGDDFDIDADIKASEEMIRVLKPGGILIFSTAITGTQPSIAFNARRNYNYEMIRSFCNGLDCIEEKFINRRDCNFCSLSDITTDPALFDYYIGCWIKKQNNE